MDPLTDGQASLQVECLAVSPANSHVVYYVDGLGLLRRSADRGDSWSTPSQTRLGAATRLLAHPGDENTVYVASSYGLWCTRDGGSTWVHNPRARARCTMAICWMRGWTRDRR
jgi:photosystem II stability/assembly factor-like uncharacterized protein